MILHRREREEKPLPGAPRRRPRRLSLTAPRLQEEPTTIPSPLSLLQSLTYHQLGRTLDQTLNAQPRSPRSAARRKRLLLLFESQSPPVLDHPSLSPSNCHMSRQSPEPSLSSHHLSSRPYLFDGHSHQSLPTPLLLLLVQRLPLLAHLPERSHRGKSQFPRALETTNLDRTRLGLSVGFYREDEGLLTRSFDEETRQRRRRKGGTVDANRKTSPTMMTKEVSPISTSSEQEELLSRTGVGPSASRTEDELPTKSTLFNEHPPTPPRTRLPPSFPLSTVTPLSRPPIRTAPSIDDHPSECDIPLPTTRRELPTLTRDSRS